MYFTVLVGFSFIAVACFLHRAVGPTAQLCVAAAVLGASAVFAGETGLLVFAAVLAVQVAIVCAPAVNAVRGNHSLVRIAPHRLLTVVAIAGAGPWLVYAFHMFRLNRRELEVFGEAGRDVERCVRWLPRTGVACRPPRAHTHPGSISPVWSLLSLAWATAVTIVALVAGHGERPMLGARQAML